MLQSIEYFDSSNLLTVALIATIGYCLYKQLSVYLECFRAFRNFPQDPSSIFTGNVFENFPIFQKSSRPTLVNRIPGKEIFEFYTEKIRKHGLYVFWAVWRPWLLVTDHRYVQTILNHKKNLDKTEFFDLHRPLFKEGLFLSTGKKWKDRRRMIEPSFGLKVLTDFIPTIKQNADRLILTLTELGRGWVQLEEPISVATLSIVCDTSMGLSTDSDVTEKQINQFFHTMRLWIMLYTYRCTNPFLWPDVLFSLYVRLWYRREMTIANEMFQLIAQKKINQRLRELKEESRLMRNPIKPDQKSPIPSKGKRRVFIDHLVDILIEGVITGTQTIDLEGIEEEISVLIFAGFDTVATSLHWTLYLLGLHLDIQEQIYQEIVQIDLNDDEITIHDLNNLPYLEQCIKEGLRMFPPAAMALRTLAEDTNLNGYKVPKGTRALLSIWSIHHDPDIYPEPYKYDPDRFSPERIESIPASAFLPFGVGPRVCIGAKFADLEMKILLAEIIRNFRIICEKPAEEILWHIPLILKPREPLLFKLVPRDRRNSSIISWNGFR